MPQFVIEHTRDFDHNFWAQLRDKLAEFGAASFSTKDWQMTANSFGFKFDPVYLPSIATHDIVIRLHLHHFEERMRDSAENARNILTLVVNLLDNYGYYTDSKDSPTVGVSLTYGPVEWAGGSRDQINSRDVIRLAKLMDGRRRPNPPVCTGMVET